MLRDREKGATSHPHPIAMGSGVSRLVPLKQEEGNSKQKGARNRGKTTAAPSNNRAGLLSQESCRQNDAQLRAARGREQRHAAKQKQEG